MSGDSYNHLHSQVLRGELSLSDLTNVAQRLDQLAPGSASGRGHPGPARCAARRRPRRGLARGRVAGLRRRGTDPGGDHHVRCRPLDRSDPMSATEPAPTRAPAGPPSRVVDAEHRGWWVSTDRALVAFRDEQGSDTPGSQDAANSASSSSVSGATHASCATSAHTVPQVLAAAAGSTTTSCTAATVPMARRQIGQVHDAAGCSALSGGSARQRRGSPARQRTGTVHSGCTCAAYEAPRRRHRRSARSLRHEVVR